MPRLFKLVLLAGALLAAGTTSNAGMAAGAGSSGVVASASQVPTSELNGTYVFVVRGFLSGVSTTSAGSFVADGAGNITSGALDMNAAGVMTHQAFTGHYTGSSADQLLLSLALPTGALSLPLYPGALNAASVATMLRTVSAGSGSSASGVFYLQDPAVATENALVPGSFIFGVSGVSGSSRATSIGRFDISASGTLANGEIDSFIEAGGATHTLEALALTGSFTVAQPSRKVTATLNSSAGMAHFNVYPVSNDQVLLLGTDAAASGLPPAAGSAIRQIAARTVVEPDVRRPAASRLAASYGFASASLASANVFSLGGASGSSTGVAMVGLIASSGSGTATITSVQQSGGARTTSSQAGVAVAVADNGRVVMGPAATPAMIAYITDTGKGFLASTDASQSFGFLEPQTAAGISTGTLVAGGYVFGSSAPETAQTSQDAGVVALDGNGTITGFVASDSGIGGVGGTGALATYTIDSSGFLVSSSGTTGYVVSPTRFVALLPGVGAAAPVVFDEAVSGSVVPVKLATGTSLNVSTNSAMSGTSIMLTATVTPSLATGSVAFYDGMAQIGMGTLASGVATFSTSSLGVGPHSLTAVYGGDNTYLGSTSSAFTVTITPADNSQVTSTANPQVAAYTLTLGLPGTVTVYFGKDTKYGFETSAQHFNAGGPAVIYVAGMLQSTTYHMHAVIAYDNGSSASDPDHTFTTGALPAGLLANIAVTPTNGLTPQPGIELIDLLQGSTAGIPSATDLSGNVLWTYLFPDRQAGSILYPIKLQPNGHFIALIAPQSPLPLTTPTLPTTLNVIREFDLAGNTIRELSMTDLNTSLAAAGFKLKLELFSHDFAVLPNGHILVIANILKAFTNLPGYPGTINVLGDVVVDLDQNLKPVWVWNQFDHLDVNRHPYSFPDWTHSNAIAYSPDDGNFLISIRHQNWIIKVDYNNGAGAGDILWKLGYQGDFKLEGATDPTDWFYAQHDINFVSSNTTGNFKVGIMDNGDDRVFPAGVTCGTTGAPPCFYTTIDVMQLDENAKTASFTFHQILPTNLYSFFAGDTRVLANGNVEYNLAGVGKDSYVFEVTPTSTPQTVLQMHITADNTYRAFRIPSLYPGVQW